MSVEVCRTHDSEERSVQVCLSTRRKGIAAWSLHQVMDIMRHIGCMFQSLKLSKSQVTTIIILVLEPTITIPKNDNPSISQWNWQNKII